MSVAFDTAGQAISRFSRAPDDEPIEGYRLIAPLGIGGFGEVWKCSAPGGLLKAIKIVTLPPLHDGESTPARHEHEAMNRIKQIRHPFLISIERVDQAADELIIVMELADHSLLDEFEQCRNSGLPGIPQDQLLHNLHEAAEVLDVLNFQHGLQHLDVKPANLLLCNQHVKLADFGLVSSIADHPGTEHGLSCCFTPRYASPELLQGTISNCCDQYSLAIAYQELLTGSVPYEGNGLLRRIIKPPNLEPLPEAERPIVARALAADPQERYGSCLDFIQALLACRADSPMTRTYRPMSLGNRSVRQPIAVKGSNASGVATVNTADSSLVETPSHRLVKSDAPKADDGSHLTARADAKTPGAGSRQRADRSDESTQPGLGSSGANVLYPPTIHFSNLKWRPNPSGEVAPPLEEFIARLFGAETGQPTVPNSEPTPSIQELDGDVVEQTFMMPGLSAMSLRLKFDKMIKDCRAELVLCSEKFVVFALEGSIPFWKLFSSKQRILKVTVRVDATGPAPADLFKVTVRIEPLDPDGASLEPSLRNIRPVVLAKIRSVLEPVEDRRKHKRLPCNFQVRLFPVQSDWRFDQVTEASAFDLSGNSIGLIAPVPPVTRRVYLRPNAPSSLSDYAVLAEIVREKRLPNGTYELGAVFGPL